MLEFLWKGKLGKWGLLKRVRFFFFLVRLVVGGVTEEDGDWRSRICIFLSYVLIVIHSSQISGLFLTKKIY